MFRTQKETIWHITCNNCSFYWTMPTMEEKLKMDDRQFTCPVCSKKGKVEEVKNPVDNQ